MIVKEDADFHVRDDLPLNWCETNYFPFNIPEARISGIFYVVTRPKLGVCMSEISIQDRFTNAWEDQLYIDNQQHLPCPDSLLKYSLPNGLSVEVLEPLKRYKIDYIGIDDTEFHLEWNAIMPPFDVNDPTQDPLAKNRVGKSWGNSFQGHYEQTGNVVGTARIRGKPYNIDCYDTLDRSWGPRNERDNPGATWLHASFGPDFTIHLMTGLEPAENRSFGDAMSGYVLKDGVVVGLTEIEGASARDGMYPRSTHVRAVDENGDVYELTGSAINSSPWAPYPSLVYFQTFMEWNMGGRIGYGIQQDVISRAYMTRHRDRLAIV